MSSVRSGGESLITTGRSFSGTNLNGDLYQLFLPAALGPLGASRPVLTGVGRHGWRLGAASAGFAVTNRGSGPTRWGLEVGCTPTRRGNLSVRSRRRGPACPSPMRVQGG